MIPLLRPVEWFCPNCPAVTQTPGGQAVTPFHLCPRRGLQAPMVPVGSGARVRYHEREDYVGRELVQKDQTGRPVMSIVTDRPDGSNDTVVLAPTVRVRSN